MSAVVESVRVVELPTRLTHGPGAGIDTGGLEPFEAALAGARELRDLTNRVAIPTMGELGFSPDEIPRLAQIAFEDPQTVGNPRELSVDGYERIYRTAFCAVD
jgi:choline dehydrogenase